MVELYNRTVRPQLVADLLAEDHFARAVEEHPEYLKGLVLNTDLKPRFAQFGSSDIELKGAESNLRWRAAVPVGVSFALHPCPYPRRESGMQYITVPWATAGSR